MDYNPLDYYGFTNVSRTHSSAEENVYSESDIRVSFNENVEAQYYLPNPEASDSESDNYDFKDMKQYIEKFRKSLIKPHGKESLDSLFKTVCYAVRYKKHENINKCSDDELRRDLPKDIFDQLNAIKRDFVLDLHY